MDTTQYTVTDLYSCLFETIADLRAKKITTEQANAIANLAQTIVNAGKLECKLIDTVGGDGTGFLPREAIPRREALRLVNRWGTKA
jgi:hypothetical protein